MRQHVEGWAASKHRHTHTYKESVSSRCCRYFRKNVRKLCQSVLCAMAATVAVSVPSCEWTEIRTTYLCDCVCRRGQFWCMARVFARYWVGGLRSFSFSRCFMWHANARIAACWSSAMLLFLFLPSSFSLIWPALFLMCVGECMRFSRHSTTMTWCDAEHMLQPGQSVHMWHATREEAKEFRFFLSTLLLIVGEAFGPVWMLCRRMHTHTHLHRGTSLSATWGVSESSARHQRLSGCCMPQLFAHLFVGLLVGRVLFFLVAFFLSCLGFCFVVAAVRTWMLPVGFPFATCGLKLLCTFALNGFVYGCSTEIFVMLFWWNKVGEVNVENFFVQEFFVGKRRKDATCKLNRCWCRFLRDVYLQCLYACVHVCGGVFVCIQMI